MDVTFKKFFSSAVVNGKLTAVGGEHEGRVTNTLLSLMQDTFQQQWIEHFPSMTFCHNNPAVATTGTLLIVAGGSDPDEKTAVEVMNTQTLQWTIVASLPFPLWQAKATVSQDRIYLGGGATKSVLMCELKHLQSQPRSRSLLTRLTMSGSGSVWREAASLPVAQSSLSHFTGGYWQWEVELQQVMLTLMQK